MKWSAHYIFLSPGQQLFRFVFVETPRNDTLCSKINLCKNEKVRCVSHLRFVFSVNLKIWHSFGIILYNHLCSFSLFKSPNKFSKINFIFEWETNIFTVYFSIFFVQRIFSSISWNYTLKALEIIRWFLCSFIKY